MEARFVMLLEQIIESGRWPVSLRPGGLELLDTFLGPDPLAESADGNAHALRVSFASALPRPAALKLLGATAKLPPILTGSSTAPIPLSNRNDFASSPPTAFRKAYYTIG